MTGNAAIVLSPLSVETSTPLSCEAAIALRMAAIFPELSVKPIDCNSVKVNVESAAEIFPDATAIKRSTISAIAFSSATESTSEGLFVPTISFNKLNAFTFVAATPRLTPIKT